MLLTTSLAILSALATVAQAQVDPGNVSGDVAVHDPTLCKDKNGKYFLFCGFPFTCSRFLELMKFSINNVSDCSRNWNSHFDGSNRMDSGGYNLAQWSAVDGCLHRSEQRVSR